ncbi:MAG: D-alanyl-D-alanine carboxypeptidase family protein [Maricaulaceae bacterium]
MTFGRRLGLTIWALVSAGLVWAAPAQGQRFDTPARFAVIMDATSGDVLFEKDADQPMAPASMSKLMTMTLVFEALQSGALSLDDELPVSEYAWRTGGAASGSSTMFLDVNSTAKVDDLLRGVIVQSGNDACIVLAEAISGSEAAFAEDMTTRARELGLDTATFRNSTGWPDPEHVISARDLARLAQYMITQFPEYYPIYAEREFTYNGVRQFNRNPLLGRFDGADGLKTGHTEVSGYGLVGSAARGEDRRIIVINGLDSTQARAQEAERMMRAAFAEFDLYNILPEGAEVGEANVFMGRSPTVALRLTEDAQVGLHRRSRDRMTVSLIYDGPLRAPVLEGDQVGRLVVEAEGVTREFALEAAETVERQGPLGRAVTAAITLLFGA